LADMITRDVRLAKKPIVIDDAYKSTVAGDDCQNAGSGINLTIKSGIAILAGRDGDSASPTQNYCLEYTSYGDINSFDPADTLGEYDSRILIIGAEDYYKIYMTAYDITDEVFRVYYSNSIETGTIINGNTFSGIKSDPNNAVTSKDYNSWVGFGGFAPIEDSMLKIQPVVKFLITVSAKDYDATNHQGIQAVIKSWVTSRNYSI